MYVDTLKCISYCIDIFTAQHEILQLSSANAHDRRIHPLCTGIPKWLCCTFFQTTQIESKRKNNPLCLMTLFVEQQSFGGKMTVPSETLHLFESKIIWGNRVSTWHFKISLGFLSKYDRIWIISKSYATVKLHSFMCKKYIVTIFKRIELFIIL